MSKDDIAEAASSKLIYLITNGRKTGKPHMVELWFALRDGRIYLSHEGEETDWMKNIRKDDKVTFQIGGKNFSGRAHFLEDGTEEEEKGEVALYQKYHGKAKREVIEDWFSLSKLLVIELS